MEGEVSADSLRHEFLGWQCRIRQLSVRQSGGRPSEGMRPSASLDGEDAPLGRITLLILKAEPEEYTAEFRHMVRRTQDPADRYAAALKFLAAAYYQRPREFSDEMTALFGRVSELADRLLEAGRCRLLFTQYSQSYDLPCALRPLPEDHPAFQATYWHNSLFNPNIPAGIQILAFTPDWSRAAAEPAVG